MAGEGNTFSERFAQGKAASAPPKLPDIVATLWVDALTPPPDGVLIEWDMVGDSAWVVVASSGPTVHIDWNSSVFIAANGTAVGVAPGTTSVKDVRGILPDSVVPAGTRVRELVVREDKVDLLPVDVGPMFGVADVGSEIAVDLALVLDGKAIRHRQRFSVVEDPAWSFRRAAALRAADVALCTTRQRELEATAARQSAIGWGVGGSLMALGALGLASSGVALARGTTESPTGLAVGGVFVGIGAAVALPLQGASDRTRTQALALRCSAAN